VTAAPLRRLVSRLAIAFLLCAIVAASAVVVANRYIDREVAKIPRVEVALKPATGSGQNFLIVGSDSRAFVGSNQAEQQAFGDTTETGPPKSDTTMVLHADGANSYAVSFPRDLVVDIPGMGNSKLNAAFNSGPQKLVDTLESNFGIDINHYLQVDFQSFQTMVDAIGGIRVWIPYPARSKGVLVDGKLDGGSGFAALGTGCWPLNGQSALAYVRARAPYYQYLINGQWVSADPIPDIGRIQRQQAFVKKLGRLTIAHVLDDPTSAPDLADKVVPDFTADKTFDRSAFNALARAFLDSGNGAGLAFDTLPWKPAGNMSDLLVDQARAQVVLDRLRGTAPIPPSTSAGTATSGATAAVRPVDVRVRVLNASGQQGAAGDAETAFGNLGFVSGGVANDPRGRIDHSEVRYLPGNEAKAQLVAASLPGAQVIADSTLSGTDIVVALGMNYSGVSPASTGSSAPGPTTTTLSPTAVAEAACDAS
jgi:LCP family protein required for cell wall assembly